MSLAVSTLEAITGEDTEEDDEVPEVLTTKEAVCVPILPPSDKECAVCRSTDLSKKYKCPKCFAKYCSMPCCRVHKTQCLGAKSFSSTAPLSSSSPLSASTHSTDGAKKSLKRPRDINDNDAMDLLAEENGWQVTELQFQALRHSPDLRRALADPKLQALVLSVDSAHDREAALVTAKHKHPQFAKFLGETLRCIGAYTIDAKTGEIEEFVRHENNGTTTTKYNAPEEAPLRF